MKPASGDGEAERPPAWGPTSSRLVGALTAIPMLIRQLGVDPAVVLADAGLRPDQLQDPSSRIPYESLGRLLNVAAARTRCPHFGLLAGDAFHLSDLGILGQIARHSRTVDEALREIVVCHHLNSEGALAFLMKRGNVVDLGFAFYFPFAQSMSCLYELVLAASRNFMRDMCGEDWRPSEVFFPHSPPADVTPYRGYFQAPTRFNSEFCSLRFPAAWLTRSIDGADPERHRLALAQAKAADRAEIVDKTHRALRALLLHGKGSGADVAQRLAMHRRTLNRRLSGAGTTFQQIVDRVRFAVAKELLENSDLTLSNVAAALGYAEEVSFIRGFRRWTGMTPGAWRRSPR